MEKSKLEKDEEVYISHIFDAPRELVFKAWTDPDQLLAWFAPHGCDIRYTKLDVRKGGSYLSCISNPQFGDCWCKGVYYEVDFLSRLEFSMIISDEKGNTLTPAEANMDPEWPEETRVTITFTEINGKTKLDLYQTVSEKLAKKTGAYPSWLQMFERLETELDKIIENG